MIWDFNIRIMRAACAVAIFATLTLFTGCAPNSLIIGLMPIEPKHHPTKFKETDSLQPLLKWAPLTIEAIKERGDKDADKISDITYDLRIWKVTNNFMDLPVYTRHSLTEPQHKVEIKLRPETDYFWSVRARYKLDGRTRITDWSFAPATYANQLTVSDVRNRIPPPYMYRFRTP